jgi:1-acyl-sn-glycerol-3-phosphate acyltransferase
MEPVYRLVIGAARVLFWLQGLRFTVKGADHVPRTGGAVFAVNHTGYMDFTYAGLAALPAGRLVRFMAKESIWRNRVAGPLMRAMKHIPVDREAGSASFRAAVDALRSGELVGVFPEATISRSFELKAFKSGAVRMAQAAGVPVVPVTIWGSQRVWTKGHPKRMGRSNVPILITVGEPIPVPPGAAGAEEANELLRSRMSEQLHADQDAYPPMPEGERHLLPARLGGTAPTLEQADALDAEEALRRRKAAGPA